MDFTTFKQTLREYLPEETDISIGNDFNINYHILVDSDGWGILTQDGKPSAHYENTVIVTANGVKITTLIED